MDTNYAGKFLVVEPADASQPPTEYLCVRHNTDSLTLISIGGVPRERVVGLQADSIYPCYLVLREARNTEAVSELLALVVSLLSGSKWKLTTTAILGLSHIKRELIEVLRSSWLIDIGEQVEAMEANLRKEEQAAIDLVNSKIDSFLGVSDGVHTA